MGFLDLNEVYISNDKIVNHHIWCPNMQFSLSREGGAAGCKTIDACLWLSLEYATPYPCHPLAPPMATNDHFSFFFGADFVLHRVARPWLLMKMKQSIFTSVILFCQLPKNYCHITFYQNNPEEIDDGFWFEDVSIGVCWWFIIICAWHCYTILSRTNKKNDFTFWANHLSCTCPYVLVSLLFLFSF